MLQWKPRGGEETLTALKQFEFPDGSIIAVFQGSKGQRPDLDIVVKFRDRYTKGKRLRTPKHIHWLLDLLLKKEHDRELTLEFVKVLLDIYDKIQPFSCKEDQQRCELKFAGPELLKKFEPLNAYGQYSVQFLTHMMELLSIEEKTGFEKAHMFRKVITTLLKSDDIFTLVATATHNGRG